MRHFIKGLLFTTCLVPGGAFAASYGMDGLTFTTETRQSVWAPGDAAEISDTYFAGTSWTNESFQVGEIVGSVSTTTIKDITYSTRLAAWEACKDSWFSDLCGSKPTDGSFTVTTDTRTGAKAEVTTSGKAGFDLNYTLSAGSLGASLDYSVEALLPDAIDVKAGEAFSLTTSSIFKTGAMDSQSPTAEASVDAVLKLDAYAKATGCVAFVGCVSGAGTFLNVNEDKELVSIDPGEIVYLDGFTPEGVEFSTAIANQQATLQAGVTAAGVPIVAVDAPGIPKPPGVYTDLGAVGFTVPTFTETGTKSGDSMILNARSDFLDLTVDLDALFGAPGGFSTSFGPLGVSLDAYDVDVGPSFDLFQDLKLTPTLMVDFDFSAPVEVAGKLVTSLRSAWDSLPDFKIFEKTTFMPTFFVDAMLTSTTGIQVSLEMSIEFLKAHLGLSAWDIELLGVDLGPLVKIPLSFDPDWAKLSIYDKTFAMGGFSRTTGDAFTLTPYSTPSPVPLPPSIALLGAAIAGLGLRRRVALA